MGRDKVQGKGKEIQSDEDASSEDHDRASDDNYSQPARSKRPMPQEPPARALGCGHGDSGNPMVWNKVLTNGPKGSCARMKNARIGDEGGRFDDDIDISLYTKMVATSTSFVMTVFGVLMKPIDMNTSLSPRRP
jgi:hypothetical protein